MANNAEVVLKNYICVDIIKQRWQCIHCSKVITGVHMRRRIEHLLKLNTSLKSCTATNRIPTEDIDLLKGYLAAMDAENERRKRKRSRASACIDMITVPTVGAKKKQSKLKMSKTENQLSDDEMHLAYARMIVMATCRSSFMDSIWSKHFFENCFGYARPCRRTVFRDLIPRLYEDTKKKVMKKLNFDDADSLVTLTMDGWVAPNGDKVRNYMAISDNGEDYLLKATCTGETAATGTFIADETLSVLDEFGPQNFSAVTTDNAANETTSWDYIRDDYPEILTTGCTCHSASLLYKDVCEHSWAEFF